MTLPEFSTHEVAELADLLVADDLADALSRVSRVACRALGGCDFASVTLWRDGRPATVGESSSRAREIDERQYAEGEGPCLQAVHEGAVVRVLDLADEPRWPSYAPRAVAAGVRSSVSLPLSASGRVVGALNAYAERPDAFGEEDIALGELLAAHAAVAVHGASLYFASRDLADQLDEALASRAVIEQAKGIVMARERLRADEAFEVLRRRSQHTNRKLRDVAAAIVVSVTGDLTAEPADQDGDRTG
jgi:GAF domain-containing protein